MDRWRYYAGIDDEQTWIWWLIDLLPQPRVTARHAYQPPESRHRVTAFAVLLVVCVAVIGWTLYVAPNGDLIRYVLAEVRKK